MFIRPRHATTFHDEIEINQVIWKRWHGNFTGSSHQRSTQDGIKPSSTLQLAFLTVLCIEQRHQNMPANSEDRTGRAHPTLPSSPGTTDSITSDIPKPPDDDGVTLHFHIKDAVALRKDSVFEAYSKPLPARLSSLPLQRILEA